MEFKKWLVSPDGGWLPDSDSNIQILLSPDGIVANPAKAFPKKDDIDIALDSFGLGNPNFEGRIGRRLYFYFSGHGVGPNFDDVAILMANASINHLNNNVGVRPYRGMLKKTARFKEIVVILDCCRDAVSGVTPADPAITQPIEFGPEHPVEDFVIMASDWGQKAFERTFTEAEVRSRLGVLTRTLLEGLNDPAAANDEGQITSETLRLYVIKRMAAISIKTGVAQNPEFKRPSNKEIVFRTLPPDQINKVKVRILAPSGPGHDGNIVLRDGGSFDTIISQRAARLLTINDPPWSEMLERNVYLVQHIHTGQSMGPIMSLDLRDKNSPYDFEFTNFN